MGLLERLLRARVTLSDCHNKDEVLGEDGETASLTSDRLQEDLSSSDDKDFSWEALEPTKCPQAFQARGFVSV
eukprot:6384153-Amphidinium_carterae.3